MLARSRCGLLQEELLMCGAGGDGEKMLAGSCGRDIQQEVLPRGGRSLLLQELLLGRCGGRLQEVLLR